MVTVIENCITEEQQSVVSFFWTKGLNAKDIHKETLPVFDGKCLSCKSKQFTTGSRYSLKDIRK
jgi:hypothetical protein